jgi:hypothetical protein
LRKTLAPLALAVAALVGACSSREVPAAPAQDPAQGREVRVPAWARGYDFANATPEKLESTSRTWGSTWADFDRDGDPDVFVNRHWVTPQLMVNANDSFRRYTGKVDWQPGPKKTDRHACAWGEANRDGRPDLYCAQGADMGTGSGPNRLYVQTSRGFNERGHAYGVTNPLGRGRTVNWIDYDSDGDLDLFVGNTERSGTTNVMFRHGRGGFVKARVGVAQELGTVGSSWADWDRDGDPDLLVEQHEPGATLAYENTHRRFRQVRLKGITGKTWLAGTWGDFNGDGWPDLAMVGRESAAIFRNKKGRLHRVRKVDVTEGRMGTWLDAENDGDLDLFVVQGAGGNHPHPGAVNAGDILLVRRKGKFVRVGVTGRAPGNGDAVSASDYDRDGRVDVLVTNGYFYYEGPNQLLRNKSNARNWAGLQLRGPRANPFGYGATVRVKTRSMTYRRQVTDNFSFRAQSEVGYVHLGLGGDRLARVRVSWPEGPPDCLRVTEGSITSVQHGRHRCR